MQIQIHQRHLEGVSNQLIAIEGIVFQELLLLTAEGIVGGIGEELLCRQKETAAAAAGIGDGFARLGAKTLDHSLDQRTGREILTCAGFDILCILLQQAFVDLTFYVGRHGNPLFLIDHLHHAIEDGGIADLVGGLLEDLPQQTALLTQFFQCSLVLFFQFCTFEGVHILPGIAGRDAGFLVIGRLGILIGHFQKDEVGKLFQIVSIGNAVVPKGIAQAPNFGDDG